MAITRTLRRQTSPRRAVAHFTSGSIAQRARRGDEIPAILWLWVLIVGVLALRRGGINFDRREWLSIGGMAAVAVAAGSVAPRLVELLLVSFLIAALLANERAVLGFLDGVEARLAALAGGSGSGGGGGGTPPKAL